MATRGSTWRVCLNEDRPKPHVGDGHAEHVEFQQLLTDHNAVWLLRDFVRCQRSLGRRIQLFDVGGQTGR